MCYLPDKKEEGKNREKAVKRLIFFIKRKYSKGIKTSAIGYPQEEGKETKSGCPFR